MGAMAQQLPNGRLGLLVEVIQCGQASDGAWNSTMLDHLTQPSGSSDGKRERDEVRNIPKVIATAIREFDPPDAHAPLSISPLKLSSMTVRFAISTGAPPSSPTSISKCRSVWTCRALLTTIAITLGLLLHAMTLRAPQWATGQTYHLASSSAFQVDLSVGLWGYCSTAKSVDAVSSMGDDKKQNCVAFHSTIGTQELSVCEAFARGFVYGTDDVRGVRFPGKASEDVHRIPRPPTSLDDVHIQRFIEKSCGVDGITTITLSWLGIVMATWTLIAFLWTLGKPHPLLQELRANPAQSNSSLLQCASLASLATVVVWLHQSWDLRRSGDTGERVSIQLGEAVYLQLAVALLYCLASVGILATGADHTRRQRPILKL